MRVGSCESARELPVEGIRAKGGAGLPSCPRELATAVSAPVSNGPPSSCKFGKKPLELNCTPEVIRAIL